MTDAASLVARVADFVATSLDDGVPVVTISRPAHRHAVDDLLVARAVDVDRARRDGALTTLDADESMARFLVDGRPDPGLFAAFVASVVPTGGPGVSAFGEMVAMLWERGEVAAALELESLWNSVIARHPVRLLCAYPGSLLADAELGDVAPDVRAPRPRQPGRAAPRLRRDHSGRGRRPLQRVPARPRGGRLCPRLRA